MADRGTIRGLLDVTRNDRLLRFVLLLGLGQGPRRVERWRLTRSGREAPRRYTWSICSVCSPMASKTVALDQEAYELLKRQKRPEESFSDTVKRLARPRRPISTFGGMWSDMSERERNELDRTYSNLQSADWRRAEKIRRLWS